MSLQASADLVRKGDPDRFLAAMAAPPAARRVLFPLYAFNVEVSRAPWLTSESMIAEMRLQWWRDVLEEIRAGGAVRRHEVVDALVPVLDAEGRFLGAVPPSELFRILREEHFEDLQHSAGISPHAEGPGASLNAPLSDRLRRRLPWLVFGLLASSLVTLVMVGFEEALEANVAVAFFVPALVYIAGAIGSQAVSVSVRALAEEKIEIGRLLRDEMIIGIGIDNGVHVFHRIVLEGEDRIDVAMVSAIFPRSRGISPGVKGTTQPRNRSSRYGWNSIRMARRLVP